MERIEKTFDELALSGRLALEHLLRRYKQDRRRHKMRPLYQAGLVDVARLAKPVALLSDPGQVSLGDFTPWLPAGTERLVLAVCTLGPAVDEHSASLKHDNFAAAAIFEEILLGALVAFTNLIHRQVRTRCTAQGYKAGAPYRPGVGRWPIECQKAVFTHLAAEKIGVTLTPELYMVPLQSTTLIIPIGRPSRPA